MNKIRTKNPKGYSSKDCAGQPTYHAGLQSTEKYPFSVAILGSPGLLQMVLHLHMEHTTHRRAPTNSIGAKQLQCLTAGDPGGRHGGALAASRKTKRVQKMLLS